jgi:hypothetical protein
MIMSPLLSLGSGLILGGVGMDCAPGMDVLLLIAGTLTTVAVVGPGGQEKRIKVGKHHDAGGNRTVFTLGIGDETVTLDPGKPWIKADQHKWVTRGLMDPPQSYHVLPNGTVDINGEKISPEDPEGIAKLEHEFKKRYAAPVAPRTPAVSPGGPAISKSAMAQTSGKVRFKVKLDHLGHLMIACARGAEQMETGLRGFQALIQNGLMLKPQSIRVDPLQRAIEIDEVRFECTEAGARQLEETLNSRYAPVLKAEGEDAIDIKENPASSTGFDIHFVTSHSGVRFEIKGHLSQEKLDLLQDPAKCELLRPGIVLRLSPPYLLIRQKRPDGGEERIAQLPDVHYRRVSAVQLQQVFNHPHVRKSSGKAGLETVPVAQAHAADLLELRLVRNPQSQPLLWLECVTTAGGSPEGKAFTHHNLADLNVRGIFLPHLDVNLSLDNRTLSVLDQQTHQEDTLTFDSHSDDEQLAKASRLLTAALKPPTAWPTEPQLESMSMPPAAAPAAPKADAGPLSPVHVLEPTPTPAVAAASDGQTTPVRNEAGAVSGGPGSITGSPEKQTGAAGPDAALTVNAAVETKEVPNESSLGPGEAPESPTPLGSLPGATRLAAFAETDPVRINTEVFRCLGPRLGLAVQDVRLSLPRVFADRRFEVVSFSHPEITSVLELRSEDFFGFYLSHVNDDNILFVYACKGKHLEWGPKRCLLQSSFTTEANEFKGSALLGMAEDRNRDFVFVVRPEYKEWVKPHEQQYAEAHAHFVALHDFVANQDEYSLIWPEPLRPPSPSEASQPPGPS